MLLQHQTCVDLTPCFSVCAYIYLSLKFYLGHLKKEATHFEETYLSENILKW